MPSLRREWREGGAPKSTYSPMVSSWQRTELPHDCRYLGYFVFGEKSAASAYPLGFACVPGFTGTWVTTGASI